MEHMKPNIQINWKQMILTEARNSVLTKPHSITEYISLGQNTNQRAL